MMNYMMYFIISVSELVAAVLLAICICNIWC